MNNKTASALEKILALKSKGNFTKAIEKIDELIKKNPEDSDLYVEGMDLCLESGETLKAWNFFKTASSAGPACGEKVWTFAKEKVKTQNDLVLAKLLIEQAIRKRDLENGRQVAYNLENHSAKELLKRIQVKKKSLQSSLGGDGAPKGELLVNLFSEALLLLRVGRTKEAARTFVHILDQKPIENEALEAFFGNLEKSSPANSSIYYALGCCYLVSEKYRKAIHHFNQSIHANQAFLDEVIERIEDMRHTDRPLPEDLELVLAEAFLMKGALGEAAGLMMHVLGQQPERAGMVFDLASRYGSRREESRELDYPYIEAAILAKQGPRAIERIRAIYEDRDTNTALMDWLDRKYTEHLLPSDIMILYGEIALAQGMFEQAAGILADVADMSPIDVPAVCRLLDPYLQRAQELRGLHDRLSKQLIESNRSYGPEAQAFEQTFEKSEFAFTSEDPPYFPPLGADQEQPQTSSAGSESPYYERELTLPEDAEGFMENECSLPCAASTAAIRLEYTPLDEDDPPPPPGAPIEPARPADAADDPAARVSAPAQPPGPGEPHDFDARYSAFLEGLMEDDDIIALIDDAFTEGETEKLKILLSFKPDGLEEETKRKLYLAQYYLFTDAPLEALAVLKSIPIDSIGAEARKDVLLKLAACYRSVHMYEAAHGALLKIKSDHPSSPVIERLLQHNYADYMEHRSSGAIVLEKTGHID